MKSLYSIENSYYRSVPEDLKLMAIEEKWFIYNSVTLGWGILDKNELEILFNPAGSDEKYCTDLYNAGLIQCNGQYIFLQEKELDEVITYFEINLTNTCNIRCKYCVSNFNYSQKAINMDNKTSTNIINALKTYIEEKNIDSVTIEFSGGEPLLNFNIIQKFVTGLANIKCNISYVIQTNGLLLDMSKIQFIKNNNMIQLAISVDGITEKQNSNRVDKNNKPILNKVNEIIKKIKSSQIPFSIVIVVSEQNVDNIEQIIQYFIENNITETFSLLPLLPFGIASENQITIEIKKYVEALIKLHENYLLQKNTETEQSIVERNMGVISSYIFSPGRGYICNQNPCGAGRKIVSIGPTGKIYPCYGFQEIDEFLLGNINDGYNFSAITDSPIAQKLYLRNVEEIESCKECPYKLWCNGGCVTNSYLRHKDIMQRDEIYCNINKSLIEKILFEYSDNDKMINYLRKIKKSWDTL